MPYVEMNGEKEYILPRADAVVDPHQPDCAYPFKGLCGARGCAAQRLRISLLRRSTM